MRMEEEKIENQNPEEQKQQDGDKISKRFDSNIKKLVALFSGEKNFKKTKIQNKDVNSIIEELTKERRDGLIKDFKDRASKLLTSKVEFDRFIIQKEKELKEVLNKKKVEFSKEMEECFNIVENIETLTKEYTESFKELNNNNK